MEGLIKLALDFVKRYQKFRNKEADSLRLVEATDLKVYPHYAVVDGNKISYKEIANIVINKDNVPNDGVGGSVFIRSIPEKDNPSRAVRALKFTFSDAAHAKVKKFRDYAKKDGARVKLMRGQDKMFRRVFF